MNKLVDIDAEITTLFRELTQLIWSRLTPIIGTVTTRHLFHESIKRNLKRFPWLGEVTFTEEGPVFSDPLEIKRKVSQTELRKGLMTAVTTLLNILAALTGDILTGQLKDDVELFMQKADIQDIERRR